MTERAAGHEDPGATTRDRIVASAAALFGEHGIEGTSVARIAAHAGVGPGTVRRHFADHTALADEIRTRLLARAEHEFTARATGLTVRGDRSADTCTRIAAALLDTFADLLVTHAPVVRALADHVAFEDSGLAAFEARIQVPVRLVLVRSLGPLDHRFLDAATTILTTTGFAAVIRTAEPGTDPDTRARTLAMTARMMGVWLAAEAAAGAPPARPPGS
ncbi:TetR/AcrR family transcriptional regulator [Nocardia thailandica]